MKYLEDSWRVFQNCCERVINLGVMNRLFSDFDFFGVNDRDGLSDSKPAPKVVKVRLDHFTEAEYEFSSDSSDTDSCNSERTFNLSTSKLDDFEVFLHGFFYFFILQDPFIRNYLNLHYEPTYAS